MSRAIRLPERLKPSRWAAKYRYLPPSSSAEPGPWRNERTPYLVGIMDATCERGVEGVVLVKAAQVGGSEALRNLLGYWIDHDPGPCLWVMPSQRACEEIVEERIRPLLADTPRLTKRLGSRRADNTLSAIRLDSMTVFTGWAGSPQALATRPIRRAVCDEVDKFPPFAGREADPISLAIKRLTTFRHRALYVLISTPTHRLGVIWSAWENATDRRWFWCPCPECGEYQRLIWSQVKWPPRPEKMSRVAYAEKVESEKLARYQCVKCGAELDDAALQGSVRRGEWRSETPGASNRRVAFHLSGLYSPWLTLSQLAGEWLRAQNNPAALMDFRNSRLAEPFEERASSTKTGFVRDKRKLSAAPRLMPSWAQLLIATADVQKDHLYYVVRAWGAERRSALMLYGIASTFEQLARELFESGIPTYDGDVAFPGVVGIDCRWRRDEVYRWCVEDPARRWPMEGQASAQYPPATQHKVRGYEGVVLYRTNPNYWKDVLHGLIHDEDATRWLAHNQIGDDYALHMASENKVLDPRAGNWVWQTVSSHAPNHYWDCEYLQACVATLSGVESLKPIDVNASAPQPGRDQVVPQTRNASWATSHKGRW